MAELKGDRGESLCGWCLTNRCAQCLPSGDDWTCKCTHPNIEQQNRRLSGDNFITTE